MNQTKIECPNCGLLLVKNFSYPQCPNCGEAVKQVDLESLRAELAEARGELDLTDADRGRIEADHDYAKRVAYNLLRINANKLEQIKGLVADLDEKDKALDRLRKKARALIGNYNSEVEYLGKKENGPLLLIKEYVDALKAHLGGGEMTEELRNYRVDVTNGMRGYFAVLIADVYENGRFLGPEPIQTSPFSAKTFDEAVEDALDWAVAEGLPCVCIEVERC